MLAFTIDQTLVSSWMTQQRQWVQPDFVFLCHWEHSGSRKRCPGVCLLCALSLLWLCYQKDIIRCLPWCLSGFLRGWRSRGVSPKRGSGGGHTCAFMWGESGSSSCCSRSYNPQHLWDWQNVFLRLTLFLVEGALSPMYILYVSMYILHVSMYILLLHACSRVGCSSVVTIFVMG